MHSPKTCSVVWKAGIPVYNGESGKRLIPICGDCFKRIMALEHPQAKEDARVKAESIINRIQLPERTWND